MEYIAVKIFEDSKQVSKAIASHIADLIVKRSRQGSNIVLGLATGHTPVGIYTELIGMHKDKGLDFSNVVTFNLDEYWPIEPTRIQSYHRWMYDNFFSHVNIPSENIHIPSGTVSEADIEAYCHEYEHLIKQAGGIDIQILGIGRTGHIGFNEPGSPRDSRTRRIRLDNITRKDAASDFFGEENVPKTAITMGIGTAMEARQIFLLAFGEHKANIIRQTVQGQVTNKVPASFLQEHPNATIYLDLATAVELTRIATPWLLGKCQWDDLLERQAVIWLADKVKKPILKLTNEDYVENGLSEILHSRGEAYDINLNIFRRMMKTITGWPGGKNRAKKILILSPHPDDDVICMGGTMIRLVEHGHDLHVGYMVSGSLSVFDYNVLRHAEFVKEFNDIFGQSKEQTSNIKQHIEQTLQRKKPCEIDTPEIQQIKTLIRRTEAIATAQYCGLGNDKIHFLELPFYNTGAIHKLSIGTKDISLVYKLLSNIKPEIIFVAGDMSDPHGTHRLCLEAFFQALEQYRVTEKNQPEVWLYRGAWQEWKPEQIDMAVPLSPDESRKKRLAIFRHESQKDRAMFPGPYDSREFWQRAEERNMTTAIIYDALGLPEYHAIEAFVRWPLAQPAQMTSELS